MSHTTVFIIMDAGRSDYVRPDTMPFLHGLSKGALTGSFESPPGFAQRTVLFSGRYPDTSGNFSQFVFDPENSPFKWIQDVGPAASLVRPKKLFWPTRKVVEKVTKWKTGAFHTDPAWIPPKFMPFFSMCEDMKPMYEPGALGAPSIFDLCREHNLTFRYLAHPISGDDEEIHQILTRELRQGEPYDLFVAQFSICDQRGHVDGPFSSKMQLGHLRRLDEKFASIHAALEAGYDSYDLFICGDHGMSPVQKEVDVLKALEAADAKPAEDYVVFVNSTIAVLWYLTERGRTECEKVLATIPGAHLVDEAERRRRRIPLDTKWGHRMLAAEPGVMFWPDYFHVQDSKIVGMHGYLDKDGTEPSMGDGRSGNGETYGACVLVSKRDDVVPRAHVGKRPLVDVFPTLCQLLNVPVTKENEGTSLLELARMAPPAIATASPRIPTGAPASGAIVGRASAAPAGAAPAGASPSGSPAAPGSSPSSGGVGPAT